MLQRSHSVLTSLVCCFADCKEKGIDLDSLLCLALVLTHS